MALSEYDISSLFVSAKETSEPESVSVIGKLPPWVKGSLYQTGPGLLDLSDFTMGNYLDGFAILTKIELKGQWATITKKYPETESFKKALEKGKPYFLEFGTTAKREGHNGIFSKIVTTFSRDDMSDNCSASIYYCNRHLIASSAATFIHKINPLSLSSEQKIDTKKCLGQNGYGVHPLIDEDGTMWNMGFSVLPTLKYNIIKIPNVNSNDMELGGMISKGKVVASISSRWNGALAFSHSFGMTKNYIIFIEQPYVIKLSRVLAATIKDYAVKDWLEWRGSEKNRFFLVEKSTGKVISTEYLSSESFFFLHIINCFEDENYVFVDVASSKTPSSAAATDLKKLRQNIIDEVDPFIIQRFIIPVTETIKSIPENCNLLQNVSSPVSKTCPAIAARHGNSIILTPETLFDRGADRAAINKNLLGKKYSIIFTAGSFLSLATPENSVMAHSICKVNTITKEVKIWTASEFHFPGEPVFIPQPDCGDLNDGHEDNGVVIAAVSSLSSSSNAKAFLVILNGKTLEEMARVQFNNQIPICMHSIFIPA